MYQILFCFISFCFQCFHCYSPEQIHAYIQTNKQKRKNYMDTNWIKQRNNLFLKFHRIIAWIKGDFCTKKKKEFLTLCSNKSEKMLVVCLFVDFRWIYCCWIFSTRKVWSVCVCVSKCLNQFTKRKTIQTKMMEIKNQRPQINVKQCIEEYGIKMFSKKKTKKKQINDNDKQE